MAKSIPSQTESGEYIYIYMCVCITKTFIKKEPFRPTLMEDCVSASRTVTGGWFHMRGA